MLSPFISSPPNDRTRQQLAAAIDLAESTGKLTLTRNDGSTVDLTLPILGIEGGIEAAFAILEEETGKAGFKIRLLMDVLPKYGAAAKPHLPLIRSINAGKFASQWQAMIQAIEALPDAETKTLTFLYFMKAGNGKPE